MKGLRLIICIAVAMILFCAMIPAQAAFAESTPILLLSGKTEGEEIVVTVTLRNNEAISAMLLRLEYDREKLVLTDCKTEDALSSLDFIPSGNYDVYPFVLSWSGDENDSSNGKLLTIRFRVKEAASGKAFVKLSYTRDRDINYYENGELMTRNLMTDTLEISLASGEAKEFVVESGQADLPAKKENKIPLIVGLSVGGAVLVALIVLVPWIVVKKRKL